jgi:peptidyl-prolyl cis-trans isomerase SurA
MPERGLDKMFSLRKFLFSAGFALLVSTAPVATMFSAPANASEIKYVVNNIAVTNYDIQRRAAFMKLQHRKGNLNKLAEDEMVEQALRTSEMKRLGIRITDQAVDDAYARFGSSNKLSLKQLDGIMEQAGVTKAHFKEYIRTQMGWNQVVGARYRAESGGVSQQDAVQRMLKQGGAKPTATEYMLQQVIFVVPAGERGNMGKRKREAEAMRARFAGCERTREFAKGLLDVTVRDIGRKLAPELPPEWADQIKATKAGGATGVRETERGVEFIGICSSREVSDDRVAQMVFQSEGQTNQKGDELSKKYLDDVRAKARIVKR